MFTPQKKSHEDPQFSKVRAALWPIQNCELKKFLPMGMMMFLVLFNYTLLRNTKDALVITAPNCGAGSQLTIAPFLFVTITIVMIGWISAVKGLSKLYTAKNER